MSFAGAPVSKALVTTVGCSSLLAAVATRQYLFDVPLSPHLTRDLQFWRLLVHHCVFANSSELFLGILVLFYTSVSVERAYGSVKYGSFLVVTTALSTVFETLLLLVGSKSGFKRIPAGPFAITFAILYQFWRIVPTTFRWKVFGFEMSNRIALYILAAQLLSSQPPASVFVCLIGFLSSYLYRSDFLSMKRFRLSPRLVRLITRLFSPLFPNSSTPRRPNHVNFGDGVPEVAMNFPGTMSLGGVTTGVAQTAGRGTGAAGGTATVTRRSATPQSGIVRQWTEGLTAAQGQPSAAQIAQMTAMFPDRSREAIIAALERSQLDPNRAAEALLTSS